MKLLCGNFHCKNDTHTESAIEWVVSEREPHFQICAYFSFNSIFAPNKINIAVTYTDSAVRVVVAFLGTAQAPEVPACNYQIKLPKQTDKWGKSDGKSFKRIYIYVWRRCEHLRVYKICMRSLNIFGVCFFLFGLALFWPIHTICTSKLRLRKFGEI